MTTPRKLGSKSIDEIKSEAVVALAGAEYIREKMYSLFDIGPNPLSRIAYAIKIRVKSDERLVQKVIARRLIRGKASYRAAHATDIVGVRLISVYSEELLDVAHRLLEIIMFAQSSNIQLFSGTTLNDCIREIVVYTSKNASYVYDLLYREFTTLHLGLRKDGTPKVTIVKSPDEKPYSSIHIVLDSVSYSAKSPKIIPIEIQVRTIFEDTWAEIDHPLQYKGFEFRTALGDKDRVRPEYNRLIKEAQKDVRLLKDKLDVISHEADNIRQRFLTIEELFGRDQKLRPIIPFSITYIRYEVDEIYEATTPDDLKSEITSLNGLIKSYYAEMFPGTRALLNEHITRLTEIISKTTKLIDTYSERDPARFRQDFKARYFLFMEKALALLWRYRIVNHFRDTKAIGFQFDVNEAIRIYVELDGSGEFPNDPMIVFRLANSIMVKGGHIDYVIKLLETAVERLDVTKRMRRSDLFRVWIPRQYAYALWKKKQYFDAEFARVHHVKLSDDYKAELLRKALSSTSQAMTETEEVSLNKDARIVEEAKNWNNWISYLWELVDLAGAAEINSYRRELEHLRAGVQLVKEVYKDGEGSINGLDTLTKAYSLQGSTITQEYVQRLSAALAADKHISADDQISVQYTLENAVRISSIVKAHGRGISHDVT